MHFKWNRLHIHVKAYWVFFCDVLHRLRNFTFTGGTTYQWHTQEFFLWGSTNSVEDRGQIERGSGGGSTLVRGSAQFANG
jgi:hypothetical protein